MGKLQTILKTMALLFIAIAVLSACSSSNKVATTQDEVKLLAAQMAGSYNSAKQAASDEDYYDISLHMYPIWTASGDNWLYVEQAVTRMADKPYRQRIYKVEVVSDNEWRSVVYEIEKPERFTGKWKTPSFFDDFDQSILISREGCAVYLKKTNDGIYEGSTRDKECKSNFRGASYATSIVKIMPDKIESWDRGFDADDNYLWGAEKGAYIFNKE